MEGGFAANETSLRLFFLLCDLCVNPLFFFDTNPRPR